MIKYKYLFYDLKNIIGVLKNIKYITKLCNLKKIKIILSLTREELAILNIYDYSYYYYYIINIIERKVLYRNYKKSINYLYTFKYDDIFSIYKKLNYLEDFYNFNINFNKIKYIYVGIYNERILYKKMGKYKRSYDVIYLCTKKWIIYKKRKIYRSSKINYKFGKVNYRFKKEEEKKKVIKENVRKILKKKRKKK